jgi:hypothetical protein
MAVCIVDDEIVLDISTFGQKPSLAIFACCIGQIADRIELDIAISDQCLDPLDKRLSTICCINPLTRFDPICFLLADLKKLLDVVLVGHFFLRICACPIQLIGHGKGALKALKSTGNENLV